jgi:hypothetical protein
VNLPYYAADTLGVTLYQMKAHLIASEIRQMEWGPWRLDLPLDVRSDVHGATEMGFWVVLNKTLRCYLAVKEQESWLFVLDSTELKAVGKKTGFSGTTAKARTLELKPAIRGVFHWKNNAWKSIQYDWGGGS